MDTKKYIRVEEGIIEWNKAKDNPKYKASDNKIDLVIIGDCCNAKRVVDKDEKYIYLSDGSKITEDQIITHSNLGKI